MNSNIKALIVGLFIAAYLVVIVVVANAIDPNWYLKPVAVESPLYGLDLVGCEEHVCIYSFPNGKLPSDGAYCYLSIAAAKPTSKWTTEMVCP